MTTPPLIPPGHGPVTVLVTRRIKPGHEADFEAAMTQMIIAAASFPGHLGGRLIRPGEEGDDSVTERLYHVIFAFDTQEHLAGWQNSPVRKLGLAAVAPHTQGEQELRQVTGLAHWFVEPQGPVQAPPPRWKVAVVTWLGIFPTVFVLFSLLSEPLAPLPVLPRIMVLTALVVLVMTWVVAPQLTGLFRPWLHPH